MQELLSVEEALARVLERTPTPRIETLGLADAVGAVLAADVVADRDYPPFDRSRVDGYAIRSEDAGGERDVTVEIPAGKAPGDELAPGQAARIFTGAPVPTGADAVAMQEHCERDGDRVRLDRTYEPGHNVTPRGVECAAGGVVAAAGTPVTPAVVGALATVGAARVSVVARPRVHVVSTGSELVPIETAPGPGQIRNSNAHALAAAVAGEGVVAVTHESVGDDADALRAAIRRGLEHDVLLLTGGVSVGDYDLVPEELERCGVETVFHGVRLQPGKPLLFGVRAGERPTVVFGLPGNPVSALVNHLLFVRQSLALLQGRPAPGHPTESARLLAPLPAGKWRRQYVPVELDFGEDDELVARPASYRGSGDVFGFAAADGLAIVEERAPASETGDSVPVLLL